MHDSGERQSFSTGAVRDAAEDKPRPDLISPFVIQQLCSGERSGFYKHPILLSGYTDKIKKHLNAYQRTGVVTHLHDIALLVSCRMVDGVPFMGDYLHPLVYQRVGKWLALGASKYEERNWEQGIPISRCVASLYRHVLALKVGKTDEDHAAAVFTNCMFIIHYKIMIERGVLPKQLDDMPDYTTKWEDRPENQPKEPKCSQTSSLKFPPNS